VKGTTVSRHPALFLNVAAVFKRFRSKWCVAKNIYGKKVIVSLIPFHSFSRFTG